VTDACQRAFHIFAIACAAIPVLLAIAVGVVSLVDRTTRQKIARATRPDLLPPPIRGLAHAAGAFALFLWTSLVAIAVCGLILTARWRTKSRLPSDSPKASGPTFAARTSASAT